MIIIKSSLIADVEGKNKMRVQGHFGRRETEEGRRSARLTSEGDDELVTSCVSE